MEKKNKQGNVVKFQRKKKKNNRISKMKKRLRVVLGLDDADIEDTSDSGYFRRNQRAFLIWTVFFLLIFVLNFIRK